MLNKSAVPRVVVEMTKLLLADWSAPMINLVVGAEAPVLKTILASLVEEVAAVMVKSALFLQS